MLIKPEAKAKLKVFLQVLAKKPCIVFESAPKFSDNTKPVYDELVKRGFEKKYKLFWYVDDDTFAEEKNGKLEYWKRDDYSNLRNALRNLRIDKGVRTIIMCNHFVFPKPICKYETVFYLTHGTPFKYCADYYSIPEETNYCIASSSKSAELISTNLNFDINKIKVLGQPRNDVFFEKQLNPHDYLKEDFERVIIWYPTFRQHKYGLKTGSKHGLPIIYDNSLAKELNEILKQNKTLIVVKPHFSQDLSYIKDLKLSNIKFIDDKFYDDNGITSYQFINACDALLTDYSSVFADYLLSDKPIGMIWEDIEEYKKNPGLHPDFEKCAEGTTKIYNFKELVAFLFDVANGVDPLKTKREASKNFLNKYCDGKDTQRVTDFIVSEALL